MSKPTVADIASIILPAGVRPDADAVERIQAAIDETSKDAFEGAGYVEQMNQKHANIQAAIAKLVGEPKPKKAPAKKAKASDEVDTEPKSDTDE